MSTLSQSIPNFLSGISQQPDNRKRPGQVKDAVNTFPDFALGMLKRPGGKFVSKLHGASASGKWFEILRDSNEKYIAQYADNVFRVWDLDGDTRMVDMGNNTGVPGTCNTGTVKTASDALNDAVADVAAKLTLLQTAEDVLVTTTAQTAHTTNNLFETELEADALERVFPGKEYELNPFSQFLKTGVLEDVNGKFNFLINGVIQEEQATPHPAIHVTIKSAGNDFSAGSTSANATVTTGTGTGLTLDVTVDGTGCVTSVTIVNAGTNYFTGDVVTIGNYPGAQFEVHALSVGTERTNEYPLLASKGSKFYELMQTVAPTKTQADVDNVYDNSDPATPGYVQRLNDYNDAVALVENSLTDTPQGKRALYDAAVANCAITSIPSNGYLYGAGPDDIELLTLNDTTFVLNKNKLVTMTANTAHSSGLDTNRAHVLINYVANDTAYTITINGTPYTITSSNGISPNPPANSDNIASALAAAIGSDATAVGPGVYISKSAAFTISTTSATSFEGMSILTETTADVSLLPLQTKNGYVVKVVNSVDIDVDDQYLEFLTDDGTTYGAGQWYETNEPGITYEFDPLTMPHKLVSQANQTFTFEPVNWKDRLVGDENTNPKPSFVDNYIDHMFFFRNRFGFLSGENVILSKAGDIDNFWATTALTATNDDPIDISVAGKKPVFLHYVEPTSIGLVLYSATEQFLLTTDSDILSPTTAKINTMSNYECDPNVEAVSLGISQAFISKTPLYTRLFELNDISADTPPLMADITNIVPELIPSTINSLKASPGLSLVSLGTVGSSTLYQYRFLNRSRDQRVVNSWYKWTLTGTLLDQFFDNSTFYAVVKNGSDVYLQSYDVTQANEQGYLSLPTGEKTDVCLDLFNINPHRTYDSATEKTRVFLPYDSVTGSTLNVLVLGEFGSILTPTIFGAAGSQYVDVDGDYRGKNLIIGYGYDMTIDLPKIYRYNVSNEDIKNDDVSSLIIHRLKFKLGLSGPVDYKVSITGIDPFTKDVTVTLPQQYNLNNVNMQASSTHVVPIFQRNENLAVQIIGNTPFPVSLLGLDWEGKLNQRFYRRG